MGTISENGRRVKDHAEEIKEITYSAKIALLEILNKVDPIEKNEGIIEALKSLEEVSTSVENIREICIRAAKRSNHGN